LDDVFNITESMAEYEAEQEAEKEDVHEYVKGNKINIGGGSIMANFKIELKEDTTGCLYRRHHRSGL